YLEVLLKWADEIRDINIRTNADTPSDATTAREFGAEGIGLCRTEHMFFGDDRIPVVREMIMAEDENERRTALAKLQPMQKDDFVGIFKAMKNYPVTIRLLDPPLHEFLPRLEELESKLVKLECDKDKKRKEIKKVRKLIERVEAVKEINPMLGHRGCRLGITFPEIYEMQVKAIIEAACELECDGTKVIPEIMIPLVSDAKELAIVKEEISEVAERVMKEHGMDVEYLIGTMIELPRAALTADKISKHADFFSFGTNDLTQTTFGFSRDDAGKYLPLYIEKQILDIDPFVSLDQEGVGELIKIGIQKGRMGNINLKVGICGEHGGEPTSIKFGYACGLDYVSCSPFRVPIARLAAAQAKIESE
ncbi:pyruvate, phosphate dikinase, partial [Methanosalsum natronophilum]